MSFAAPTVETPDAPYEEWRENWQWEGPRPLALPGKLIVEFSPAANHGRFWTPERESFNAIVVSDGMGGRPSRDGYIPFGQEIGYTGTEGTYFEFNGRRLCVINKAEVEMLVTG